MTRIPAAALLLTLGGLIPFLYAATLLLGFLSLDNPLAALLGTDARLLMARYGVVILCFMAGVLWGFATKTTGARAAAAYGLSVVPTLWIFLNPGRNADEVLINLIIGFVGVLALDFAFYRWRLAPAWWMALRVPVTVVVVLCLGLGLIR